MSEPKPGDRVRVTIESVVSEEGRYAAETYIVNDLPGCATGVEVIEKKAKPLFRHGDVILLSRPKPLFLIRTCNDTWHRIGDTWSCDDTWVQVQLDNGNGRLIGNVSELNQASESNAELRRGIATLEARLEAASSVADQAVDAKIALEKRVADAETARADQADTITTLKVENKRLREALGVERASAHDRAADLSGKIDELTDEIERLESENVHLRGDRDNLAKQNIGLKGKLGELRDIEARLRRALDDTEKGRVHNFEHAQEYAAEVNRLREAIAELAGSAEQHIIGSAALRSILRETQ